MLRQFLRNRRMAKRIRKDEARDALLKDEAGRAEYWSDLGAECAESSLIAVLEEALTQPGDIIECGVYRGGTLRQIAKTAKDNSPEKTIFGLDSFEGFPEDGITDADTQFMRGKSRLAGKFKDAFDVPTRLEQFAQAYDIRLELRKGYFEHTLPGVVDRTYCFLHIDCDTYAGHKEVLEALYDRVVPGGIVAFDDYQDPSWPGATKAVDEFFADKEAAVELASVRPNSAWFLRKPR